MNKVWKVSDKEGEAYAFNCPACNMVHLIPISYHPDYQNAGRKVKPVWKFNGDLSSPTFQPDLKIKWYGSTPPQCCHSIIRNGEIIFLVESTHPLSGSRLKMVPV